MNRKIIGIGLICMLIAGGVIYFQSNRDVTLTVNGENRKISTHSLTVGVILQDARISVESSDQIIPGWNALLLNSGPITLNQAVHYQILVNGHSISFISRDRVPGKILSALKLTLNPGDRILVDGTPVSSEAQLLPTRYHTLEIRRAVEITLQDGTAMRSFYSAAPTIGEALWDEGYRLTNMDQLEPGMNTLLTAPIQAVLHRAQAITVTEKDSSISVDVPSKPIGLALARAGFSLQNGDYVLPPENDLPQRNGQIKITRTNEQLVIAEKILPYQSVSQLNDNVELDQKEVVQNGEYGISIHRERVLLEDGAVKNKLTATDETVKQPVDEIVGYGTKIQVHSLDTPSGTIQYYRAVQMYATAYSPCHVGTGACSNSTASGMPVKRGVVAVILRWYAYMAGQSVYIPGYGTAVIGDTGGGIPGTPWIDLAFTDAEYEEWHSWVTVYFLAPPPSNILYDLN